MFMNDVITDEDGNAYSTDSYNNHIIRITPGSEVTRFATSEDWAGAFLLKQSISFNDGSCGDIIIIKHIRIHTFTTVMLFLNLTTTFRSGLPQPLSSQILNSIPGHLTVPLTSVGSARFVVAHTLSHPKKELKFGHQRPVSPHRSSS